MANQAVYVVKLIFSCSHMFILKCVQVQMPLFWKEFAKLTNSCCTFSSHQCEYCMNIKYSKTLQSSSKTFKSKFNNKIST